MVQNDNNITDGTFAVPRYHLDPTRPEYKAVKALFDQIEWRQKTPRKDFLQNRFNAFCTIIAAVRRVCKFHCISFVPFTFLLKRVLTKLVALI